MVILTDLKEEMNMEKKTITADEAEIFARIAYDKVGVFNKLGGFNAIAAYDILTYANQNLEKARTYKKRKSSSLKFYIENASWFLDKKEVSDFIQKEK